MSDAPWFGETSDELFYCPQKAHATMQVQREHKTRWRDEEDGTCSYCGSLKPSVFFQALADGAEYHATTKSYKVYLGVSEAPRTRGACKFYFVHMNKSDKLRFIDLMNDGTIKVSVMPYFVRKSE